MSRSRRPFGRSLIPSALLIAATLLVAGPAWGYIVFLKDGSQIATKEKPQIDGDRAILILPNGTQAFYEASEIDLDKTAKVNEVQYGTATLLEHLDNTKRIPNNQPPPEEEPSFGEYISGRSLALPELKKRQTAEKPQRGQLPTTSAGFVDLYALRRVPYPNAEVTSEVIGYLKGQGVDRVRIFQGTRSDRPLLEVVAASEASVFKAITDSAQGLAQIHGRVPGQVAAFELVLMNESQQRAGQFLLTPERANMLVSGSLSVSQFFLRYVEF